MPFTEFTVRASGSNLYAGTLDGSAEASTSPLVTYTNGGWNSGTGVFTPASGNPVSAGVAVGNWVSVYTDGASAPTGFVARVTAVSSTTITLSTTAKAGTAPTTAGTGLTAVVGGAWAGPSGASGFPFAFLQASATNASGNPPRVNFKNDQTHAVTAAISHTISGPAVWEGYASTFGDGGRTTISGGTSGASYVVLSLSGSGVYHNVRHLIFANNGATGSATLANFGGDNRNMVAGCVFTGGRGTGAVGMQFVECESYSSLGSGFDVQARGSIFLRCVSHDNSSHGFTDGGWGWVNYVGCVADTNGGSGFHTSSIEGDRYSGCTSYGNTADGFRVTQAAVSLLESCVFASNGGYGANFSGVTGTGLLRNCAYWSNTSGETNNAGGMTVSGSVTLTGNPFADAANGDFDLNNTAGAGAACRGTGRGTFLQTASSYSGTLGYPDIGAAQSQASGGSAAGYVIGG